MTSDATLAAVLSARTEPMLNLIEELVRQNSHTANKAGGDAVGRRLVAEAVALGLTVNSQSSERFADHLVFSTPGVKPGFVVLVGHIDTVFPVGTFEGFSREGDLIRGPGVLDMKGGIVIMLEAVRSLFAVERQRHHLETSELEPFDNRARR